MNGLGRFRDEVFDNGGSDGGVESGGGWVVGVVGGAGVALMADSARKIELQVLREEIALEVAKIIGGVALCLMVILGGYLSMRLTIWLLQG